MSEFFHTSGAIDLHVHLREPSTNVSETIASGTRAAALGGYKAVGDMSNNIGAEVYTEERVDTKHGIILRDAYIAVATYAGSQPDSNNIGQLSRMARKCIGVKFYETKTTGNDHEWQPDDFDDNAREWHKVAPIKPIMVHPGANNLEETIGLFAQDLGHQLHVCHVNSPEQVKLVDRARRKGLAVTCGVTPHHLLMSSFARHSHGTLAEVKPDLAHQDDAEELMYLLANGQIEAIETDFAPHSLDAKLEAEHHDGHCFGMPGIEHVLPVLFHQVKSGRLSFERLIDATETQPARIFGIKPPKGDYVWRDEGEYRIGDEDVEAGCGWSPYVGMLAIGRLEEANIENYRVVYNGRARQDNKYSRVFTQETWPVAA